MDPYERILCIIYIFIEGEREREWQTDRQRQREIKHKTILSQEFNMKESRCYNVPVLINDHQDSEKMISNVVLFLNPDDGLLKPKRYSIDFLSH